MDNQPQSTQPISDDQELAKVLAGVNSTADDAADEAPKAEAIAPAGTPPVLPAADDTATDAAVVSELPSVPADLPTFDTTAAPATGDLDGVKMDAINELRPLVDKLNLSPEEKFDTYLLLIRSTDDKTLVAPAHEAAKQIADESRRAQALLDIIKEIDFLSGAQPQA